VNRLFDDLLGDDSSAPSQGLSAGTGWPQLEIEQQDDSVRIVADLPGVSEDDIDLRIEDGMLTLAGEKRSERKSENGYSERSYGRFERRVSLPPNIDEDQCSADFRNGVLTVTIPRSEAKARGRRIPLGSGGGAQGRTIEAQNDREAPPRQQAAEEPAQSPQAEDWQPENQQG
jgi:HSP20 family protein